MPRRRAHRKRFAVGQEVEFQRETGYTVPWEPGIYVKACADWRGFHEVRLPDDAPDSKKRRIDSMTGMETTADDPQSFVTDRFFLPTRRLRQVER